MVSLKTNYWLDIGMGISFIFLAVTGIMKLDGGFRSWHTLSEIHDWSGIILCCFVLLHLILHWRWIVTMTKQAFKRKEKSE